MKWTNNNNLPQPIVSAIKNDSYHMTGKISATGLIRPPRMRMLEKRHWDEISDDVANHVWSLLGQSIHAVLERSDTTNHLSEERMSAEVLGWKVSGQPDLLDENGILDDYKVTSCFSFLLGDKPEWEAQLNIYAWLYREHGFKINKLRIIAILRDWVSSRALTEPDYPQCGIMVVEIPIWPEAKIQAYIEERVRLHQESENTADNDLQACTAQERWERPESFAVMKTGNKKATRVFQTKNEADTFASTSTLYSVIHRLGESIRCERFCKAAPFCSVFAKNKKQVVVA